MDKDELQKLMSEADRQGKLVWIKHAFYREPILIEACSIGARLYNPKTGVFEERNDVLSLGKYVLDLESFEWAHISDQTADYIKIDRLENSEQTATLVRLSFFSPLTPQTLFEHQFYTTDLDNKRVMIGYFVSDDSYQRATERSKIWIHGLRDIETTTLPNSKVSGSFEIPVDSELNQFAYKTA